MGPKRAFLTFQAELKKVLDGWIRPKMADSRADFSVVQEDVEVGHTRQQQPKIGKFQIANRPQ